MDSLSRAKLGNLLIAKSMGEALLVAAIGVAFYLSTANPWLRGSLDVADATTVSGWASDERAPWTRVEVQLYVDGNFVADKSAAEFRPDVRGANRANDDWHGFTFDVPPLPFGEHEARVYGTYVSSNGARRTLQLIGKPLRFRIKDPSERGRQH